MGKQTQEANAELKFQSLGFLKDSIAITMDDSANSSDIELSPSITQEIQQLADSLKQTNENLYTFQFMLNQYKKLARVAPIQNTVKNDCIEKELKQISHSIKQLESKDYSSNFQELKDHLSQPQNSI